MSQADKIRAHILRNYIEPAIARGERHVQVRAGDIHRDLKLRNRARAVCSAMRSREFLLRHGLKIASEQGPPSGESTTVTILYEIKGKDSALIKPKNLYEALMSIKGIAKGVFAPGEFEQIIREGRENFYSPGHPLGDDHK